MYISYICEFFFWPVYHSITIFLNALMLATLKDAFRDSEEVCIAVLSLSQRENYGLALEVKEVHSALSRIIVGLEDAQ